jgi:hypothetical protein
VTNQIKVRPPAQLNSIAAPYDPRLAAPLQRARCSSAC